MGSEEKPEYVELVRVSFGSSKQGCECWRKPRALLGHLYESGMQMYSKIGWVINTNAPTFLLKILAFDPMMT